jgi:hypothetical protein
MPFLEGAGALLAKGLALPENEIVMRFGCAAWEIRRGRIHEALRNALARPPVRKKMGGLLGRDFRLPAPPIAPARAKHGNLQSPGDFFLGRGAAFCPVANPAPAGQALRAQLGRKVAPFHRRASSRVFGLSEGSRGFLWNK